MKHLLIIGARGWGREVYAAALVTKAYLDGEYDIKGFLDDKADALDGLCGKFPPILGPVETYAIQEDDVFFCALGDPVYRKKYVEIIESHGGDFISIISPLAIINPTAKIGNGSIISCNSLVSDNVVIGRHCVVHGFATLGHDVVVGDYVSIESYSFLGGYATVGEMSTIHVRSTILRHKKVGRNASVGAASVVLRDVKDSTSVYGNPAKKIE